MCRPSTSRCTMWWRRPSGTMQRCWRRCGRRCCRRSRGMGRWRTGSSTTAAFPSRARTRWAWRGNTAASWASRRTAKWRSASQWPMTTPACRSPTNSSCRRSGRTIRPAGPRPGCRTQSASETKTAIALGQLRQALAAGVPVGILLGEAGQGSAGAAGGIARRGDPAYGDETAFRVGVADLGLRDVLGVRSGTSVWAPGTGPLPPAPWSGRGRRPTRLRREAENQPVSLKALALSLPAQDWRKVTWREGTQGKLSSRFAAVRVPPAHRDTQRSEPWPEEWLLIEWPEGDAEPAKYWFSNLPQRTSLKRLVKVAKARWWIERDYQELKQELGLGHYEGRNWRGFHHHASLCIAAYGFLIAERCLFPPQQQFIRRRIKTPALPAGFRLRGSASAACAALDRFDPS